MDKKVNEFMYVKQPAWYLVGGVHSLFPTFCLSCSLWLMVSFSFLLFFEGLPKPLEVLTVLSCGHSPGPAALAGGEPLEGRTLSCPSSQPKASKDSKKLNEVVNGQYRYLSRGQGED